MQVSFLMSAALVCWLVLPGTLSGADAVKTVTAPPGSLVLRGPAKSTNSVAADATGSVEYALGLKLEKTINGNDFSVLAQAIDAVAFYQRFVPTLPVSDATKEKLYENSRTSDIRSLIQDRVTDVVRDLSPRFLGVRFCGTDTELLFRDKLGGGAYKVLTCGETIVEPTYVGLVTRRQADGSVRIIDVYQFDGTGLLSQTFRHKLVSQMALKGLLVNPLNEADQAWVALGDALSVFLNRCKHGLYGGIKNAYYKLPAGLQNDRLILFSFANSGGQNLKDIMVPLERWRQLYPTDPTPDLILVNFYWRLYFGPRSVAEEAARGTFYGHEWTAQQAAEAEAAIQDANKWFGDPMMEIRMAQYYNPDQPAKARALLLRALKRIPFETRGLEELLKVNLVVKNFPAVADELRQEEELLHTNLTQSVKLGKEYAEFRTSYAYKQWQHEVHGVDIKTLLNQSGQ